MRALKREKRCVHTVGDRGERITTVKGEKSQMRVPQTHAEDKRARKVRDNVKCREVEKMGVMVVITHQRVHRKWESFKSQVPSSDSPASPYRRGVSPTAEKPKTNGSK